MKTICENESLLFQMSLLEMLKQSSWLTLTVLGIGLYWLFRKVLEQVRISDLPHKAIFISNADFEIGQEIALKCAKNGFVVYAGFSKIEVFLFKSTYF